MGFRSGSSSGPGLQAFGVVPVPLRPHPTRLRSSVPRSPACGRGHGLALEADAPWCLEDPGDAGPGPVAVSTPLPGDGATPGTRPRCTVPMGSSARARPTGGPAALGPWCCSLGRRGGGTQEPERAGRRLREVARPTVSCAGPRRWLSLCGQAASLSPAAPGACRGAELPYDTYSHRMTL